MVDDDRLCQRDDKPKGTWLSVDHDWERWCTIEEDDWYNDDHISATASSSGDSFS